MLDKWAPQERETHELGAESATNRLDQSRAVHKPRTATLTAGEGGC